jgi:hypothetical protein
MPNLTLPINLDFERWANQIRIDLSKFSIPIHQEEENWRDWANQIIISNSIKNVPLPTEEGYPNQEDWREWAIRFYQVMQSQ